MNETGKNSGGIKVEYIDFECCFIDATFVRYRSYLKWPAIFVIFHYILPVVVVHFRRCSIRIEILWNLFLFYLLIFFDVITFATYKNTISNKKCLVEQPRINWIRSKRQLRLVAKSLFLSWVNLIDIERYKVSCFSWWLFLFSLSTPSKIWFWSNSFRIIIEV